MRWKIEAIYTKHIQNKKRSDWIDIHEDEDGDDDKDKGWPSRNLDSQKYGPYYIIERIGKVAYWVNLPTSL